MILVAQLTLFRTTAGLRYSDGNTPLHQAIKLNQSHVADVLAYAAPMCLAVTNKHGLTPIHYVSHCPEFIASALQGYQLSAK